MKQTVVFLASLSYSGSTLTDLLLGSHPEVIGLGEVIQLLHRDANFANRMCSCGSRMNDCIYWGPLCTELKNNSVMPIQQKYDLVFDHFRRSFGSGIILVDSSKGIPALAHLVGRTDVDLKVIYLVKDVRSWVVSRLRHRSMNRNFNSKLKRRYGWRYPLMRILSGMPLYYFGQWFRKNKEMIEYLRHLNCDVLQVSYDLMTASPTETIERICKFLNLQYLDAMLDPGMSASHIVRGNNMRSKKDKRERIFYDTRWLTIRSWVLPSFLMPAVMRLNQEIVYSSPFRILAESKKLMNADAAK